MDNKILLNGKDSERGIVGLAVLDDKRVTIWTRNSDDTVSRRNERVWPFLFCTDAGLQQFIDTISSSKFKHRVLNGENPLRHLLVFDTIEDYKTAKRVSYKEHFKDETFSYPNIESQYLIQTGKTMFGGLTPDTVVRLQLDIETYTTVEGSFSRADRDPIIIVSMTDNRGYRRVLHLDNSRIRNTPDYCRRFATERELLVELVKEIHRRDPDIIELHNGLGFDLDYIRDRCAIHEVNFAIGRDSKVPKMRPAEKKFAERDISYTKYDVGGRSIIDTMFLAIDWDVYARKLNGVGLKQVAKDLGKEAPNRTYIEGDKIRWFWDNCPEDLINYALDDVIETRGIADHLCPSVFALTQFMPLPYQEVHLRGKSAVIQSMFVREYLRQRVSLPIPQEAGSYEGGYTDIFQTGVFENLLYADVASLYPSIMLNYGIQPASDTLEIFQRLLQELTDLRFAAKNAMKKFPEDSPEYRELDAKQSAYKIIINSFYGALGAGRMFLFSDAVQADLVTRNGRSILRRLMQLILEHGGDIIEVDTDGVLFVRPETGLGSTKETHLALIQKISDLMPTGIDIDLDGYFVRMLSLMKKNYALVDENGKVKMKGGSLKSRGLEPALKDFVQDTVKLLLDRDVAGIHERHNACKMELLNPATPPVRLSKRATLKDSFEVYEKKIADGGKRMAQYEIGLRLRAEGKPVGKGDRIQWVICGDKPRSRVKGYVDGIELTKVEDEGIRPNRVWYVGNRLKEVSKKFEGLFSPADYKIVFDRTIPDGTGDLFPESIKIDATVLNTRLKECLI